MKLYTLSILLAASQAVKLHQSKPFMIDGEVLADVDVVPDIPDPVDYDKIHEHDDALIQEAARELGSAAKNADRGELNREMAMALVSDAKKNMFDVHKSISTQLSASDSQLAQDVQGTGHQMLTQTDLKASL